jgi:FimV-like protein
MAMSQSARRMLLCAVLALLPGTVHALGLGKLTVLSPLGERLDAYIEFTSLNEHEVKTLRADIVKRPDVLPAIGVEPTSLSPDIGVTLVEHEDGQYTLQLSSEQPFREPFVRFLVQIDWAGGRLVREFMAPIDPPGFGQGPKATRTTAPVVTATSSTPASITPALPAGPTDNDVNRSPSKYQPETTAIDPSPKAESRSVQPRAAISAPASAEKTTPRPAVRTNKQPYRLPGGSQAKTAPPPLPDTPPRSTQRSKNKPAPTAPEVAAQQRRLESEIEAWVEAQQQATPPKPATRTSALPATVAKPASQPVHAGARPTSAPQRDKSASTVDAPWFANGENRWLLIDTLVAAGLLLLVGGVALFIYLRRDTTMAAARQERIPANPQERLPVQAVPVIHDRRSGRGRRRRFVPVPFERRRGARRYSDQIPDLGGPMDTVKADTVEETETYLACGRDEHAEKALKEAIAEDPDRQALKVKLLSIYYLRQDKEAFEDLANQLYAELDPSRPGAAKAMKQLMDVERRAISEQELPESETEFSFELLDPYESKDEKDPIDDESGARTRLVRVRDKDRSTHTDPSSRSTEANSEDSEPELGAEPGESPDPDNHKKTYERDLQLLDTVLPTVEDDAAEIIFDNMPPESPVEDKAGDEIDDVEDTATRGMPALQVDDFDSIKNAVESGTDKIKTEATPSKGKVKKKAKRTRKGKRKRKSGSGDATHSEGAGQQWKDPAAKIDLAKAYIDRGDPEHARSLLEDVLKNWSED